MARNKNRKPGNDFWKGKCANCGESITKRNSLAVPPENFDDERVQKMDGRKYPRLCRKGCKSKEQTPATATEESTS